MKKKEYAKHCAKRLLTAFLCAVLTLTVIPISTIAAADKNATDEKLREASSDFLISGETLIYYHGAGGDVKVPEGVTRIAGSAFKGRSSLTSVTIPEGVAYIGESAFKDCSSLTSVTIPEGVTYIGESAFKDCSSLTSITLPDSVTEIGSYVFSGTKWFTERQKENPLVIANHILLDGTAVKGDVEVPKGVTIIADSAFKDCNGLTSITLPEGILDIGVSAFMGCSALTSVIIPEGLIRISNSAFKDCSSLSSITFPASLKYVWANAFCGTKWFTKKQKENPMVVVNNLLLNGTKVDGEAIIPEGVTAIAFYAFEGSGLTSVTIPGSITSVNMIYFDKCDSLTSVTLLEGITEIRGYTFKYCKRLETVTIPQSVTTIGKDAFPPNIKSLHVFKDSYAHQYAIEQNIPYTIIKEKKDISNATITIPSYTCTGQAIRPTEEIMVKLGDKELVYGLDYEVTEYAENTNPGMASVTITGNGDYTGTKTTTFKINLGTPDSLKQSARTVSSVKLSWKKVPGATSYIVESAPYGSKKFKRAANVNTTSCTINKLFSGQFYQYRVRACYGKLMGAYSRTITANTDLGIPMLNKVTLLKNKQAAVTWKRIEGATGYEVHRAVYRAPYKRGMLRVMSYEACCATFKDGNYKKVALIKSTKYSDKKLLSRAMYCYKVRAYKMVKINGKLITLYSDWSKVKSIKVK